MCLMFFSMTIGFGVIRYAQQQYQELVVRKADELATDEKKASSAAGQTVRERLDQAMVALDNEPLTWRQRLFSLKALHGYLMTVAWYQMFGRLIITNPAKFDGCWTYPASKVPNDDGTFSLVPAVDPDYAFNKSETTFAVSVTVPALIVFAIVGVVWSIVASRRSDQLRARLLLASSPSSSASASSAATSKTMDAAASDEMRDCVVA